MDFRFYRLRFHFAAVDAIHFPPGNPANILRGAFGTIFRKLACQPECWDSRTCPVRHTCAYARTFEPSALGAGPSGLADWPRPFVFRATHLDGLTLPAGAAFHFDVHLFQIREPAHDYFIRAFEQLAHEGLGPGRGRASLDRVGHDVEPTVISLAPRPEPVNRIEVHFVTPTELKAGHEIAAEPEFGILLARIRDRLSTLSALYADTPWDMDFVEFGRRAAEVRMTHRQLATVKVMRQSTRTGQRHPLGGFTGKAVYEGDLAEFVPFLEAAQFSGVGRQTTWGKGEIQIAFGIRAEA